MYIVVRSSGGEINTAVYYSQTVEEAIRRKIAEERVAGVWTIYEQKEVDYRLKPSAGCYDNTLGAFGYKTPSMPFPEILCAGRNS